MGTIAKLTADNSTLQNASITVNNFTAAVQNVSADNSTVAENQTQKSNLTAKGQAEVAQINESEDSN